LGTAWSDFRGAFYFRAAGQSIDDGDLANIVVFLFLVGASMKRYKTLQGFYNQ